VLISAVKAPRFSKQACGAELFWRIALDGAAIPCPQASRHGSQNSMYSNFISKDSILEGMRQIGNISGNMGPLS
jgi:hypothetical protein